VPPQYEITLEILSGDDEAKYEHTSAVYSAQLCGYHDENEHVKIGLLSSGGMSSQIHFDGLSVSIDTLIKKGNALGEEKGMDHAVDWFRGHIRAEVDRTLVDNFGQHHEHETLFLAIEMFAAVGEKAGMKGQVVPATDAVNRLEAYVDQLIDADKLLDSEAKRSWKTYVHVMSGIMSAYILSRLHNEANVLFLRQYQHEPSGATLKPSWCLGHAISSLGLA
jgi:hypothetical protein